MVKLQWFTLYNIWKNTENVYHQEMEGLYFEKQLLASM